MSDSVITNDHTEEVLKALAEAVKKSAEAVGLQAEGHAKVELRNAPKRIDTGLLKNSITHATSGSPPAASSYRADTGDGHGSYTGQAPESNSEYAADAWVGTNVEYAYYVHDGTRRMTPNRFLKNAATNYRDEYKGIVEQQLKNA